MAVYITQKNVIYVTYIESIYSFVRSISGGGGKGDRTKGGEGGGWREKEKKGKKKEKVLTWLRVRFDDTSQTGNQLYFFQEFHPDSFFHLLSYTIFFYIYIYFYTHHILSLSLSHSVWWLYLFLLLSKILRVNAKGNLYTKERESVFLGIRAFRKWTLGFISFILFSHWKDRPASGGAS